MIAALIKLKVVTSVKIRDGANLSYYRAGGKCNWVTPFSRLQRTGLTYEKGEY